MVGLDSAVISSAKVWIASGHTANFADAMVDCKTCHSRTRADHLIEDYFTKKGQAQKVEGKPLAELAEIIEKNKIKCPTCGSLTLTEPRLFNQLFPVHLGILESTADLAYLRGETAQGIFTNFKNILDSTRVRLPFGVGQMGKSFRNEITKGQATFRTVEFEQGEIEYFFDPSKEDWEKLFQGWLDRMKSFLTDVLGVKEENLAVREHDDEEQRRRGTDGKGRRRGERRLNRSRLRDGRESEFITRVGGERVLGGQLHRHLGREHRRETATHVDPGQLSEFAIRS